MIDKGVLNSKVTVNGLGSQVHRLHEAAKRASMMAVPTNSGFTVGCAALLQGSNEIITGFNIEKSCCNDAMHAEESMMMGAKAFVSSHPEVSAKPLEAVLVTAECPNPISPCGPCRDWLRSYSKDNELPVLMANNQGDAIPTTIGYLLPGADSLVRADKAAYRTRLSGSLRHVIKACQERAGGKVIWGMDIIRYVRFKSEKNVFFHGWTVPRSDYHGVSAVESAFVSVCNQAPGFSGRIVSALVVVPDSEAADLIYGCERQCLFELAIAQKRDIDVYVATTSERSLKTSALSLLPFGFAAEPVIQYIRAVILPEKKDR